MVELTTPWAKDPPGLVAGDELRRRPQACRVIRLRRLAAASAKTLPGFLFGILLGICGGGRH